MPTSSCRSGWVGLQRRLALPLVMTFHSLGKVRRAHQGDYDRFPHERFAMEEAIVRDADVLVSECPQDRADLIFLYAADPARIDIVRCDAERAHSGEVLGWDQTTKTSDLLCADAASS